MGRRILMRLLFSTGVLTALMLLAAPPAYADNCGSLNDCFQSEGAAAAVSAGVAILIAIAVLVLPALLGTGGAAAPDRYEGEAGTPEARHDLPPSGRHPEHGGEPFPPPGYPGQPSQPFPHPLPPGQPQPQPFPHPQPPSGYPGQPQPPFTQPLPPGQLPHPLPSGNQPFPHAAPPGLQGSPQPLHTPGSSQPASPGHAALPDQQGHAAQAADQGHAASSDQQAQLLRSDQQAQVARPDQQAQVIRPGQQFQGAFLPPLEPQMGSAILGIHHVTAIAGNPQQNLDFYTGLLGLRLVKLTVNFDNPDTYHLYYGDELGRPGTILSFFSWPGASSGSRGTGQPIAISFSIPEGTLNQWREYLTRHGISVTRPLSSFDDQALSFFDPDGLQIELVANRDAAIGSGWAGGPIPLEYAIRGLYSATLLEADPERTHVFLTEVLGFRRVREVGNRFRYETGNGGPGALLDLLSLPGVPPSQAAVGTIHHIAWRTRGEAEKVDLQHRLLDLNLNLLPGTDRQYFPSITFFEPGGVLFEIASDRPGFTVDEPPEGLGTHLTLPGRLEPRRSELEQTLPPLRLPPARR